MIMDSLSVEKLPKELLEKIVRKHTFHLICSRINHGVSYLYEEATYENITFKELPLRIMKDQSLGETLFREIIKFENDYPDRWKVYRKDKILKRFIKQIDADCKWIDNNEIESEYIERIFTKYHPNYSILDAIKQIRMRCIDWGSRASCDMYGIYCNDDYSYHFIESLLILDG